MSRFLIQFKRSAANVTLVVYDTTRGGDAPFDNVVIIKRAALCAALQRENWSFLHCADAEIKISFAFY